MMGAPVVLLLLLAAPTATARRLPIQLFTTAKGIPRNSAGCVVPDPNGVLWLCTSEGLVRFDGSEFRVFDEQHGLPSRRVVDFSISQSGGYWLLTDAGVCFLASGSKVGDLCEVVSPVINPGDLISQSLVEAPGDEIWVATDKALYLSGAGPGPGFTARPYHAKEFFEQLGISTVVALSNNDPAKDARVVFDVTRKRFFLVFQSRESPARLLIAVSKSEDPSDGFFAYADVVGAPGELVHDYQRVGVNSNFLLVSNDMVDKFPGGNFVRTRHLMYSAASLATGMGIDRSEWWHPNAQNASLCVHNSPCQDVFYAHRDDDSHASIWAVRDGNVTSVQFSMQQSSNAVDGVQKGGKVVDFGGTTMHRDVQNSEYRDGRIVFGSNDATTWPGQSSVSSAVRLIRVNVSQLFHSPPSVTVEIDRIYGLNSENDPPNSVFGYGFPAVATNQKGDIVVGCVRSNAAIFTQLRASVWYKDQADIGPSVLLAQSESTLTAFHMAGACADPSSDGVYLAQQFGISGGTWRIRVAKMLDYPL